MMGVIDLQVVSQTGFKRVGRIEIASCEKLPGHNAEPQLHLVEPRAVFRRKMEHMPMARIAQESLSLPAAAQVLGHIRDLTPLRHAATDREAPMGIEIIDHPIVAPHSGQLSHNVLQMRGKIGAGAGLPDVPHDVPCRDDKRRDQSPHTMADILVFAFLGFPRDHRLGGVFALQNLPTSLFIRTNNQPVVRKEAEGVEVQGTDRLRFRVKVRVVAIEPIDTAMGFEVRLVQNAPDTRATHGSEAPLLEAGHQTVQAPARSVAVVRRGLTGGHRHHCEPG